MTALIKSQARMLQPHWPAQAKWFVIGGPATQHEAHWVKHNYPDVRCIGFEPNAESFHRQVTELLFPGEIHQVALWHENTTLTLAIPSRGNDSGSVCREGRHLEAWDNITSSSYQVEARTLDFLSKEHGPFEDVVLWLDIEYAELSALRGAEKLLDRTLLINLETYHHRYLPDINRLLDRHGFILRTVWNFGEHACYDAQDYIYVRKENWR